MTNANEILEAAMSLPPEARAQIADQLLASLDPAQAEVDAAWEPEIERRVREIEEGRVQLVPHDEVMSHVRDHLRSMRGK
jgi:putative addiction module component (TIGR02574 family)